MTKTFDSSKGQFFVSLIHRSNHRRKIIFVTVVVHVFLTIVAADRYPEGRREDGDSSELPDTELQVDGYRTLMPSSPNVGPHEPYPILTTDSPQVLPMTLAARNRYVGNPYYSYATGIGYRQKMDLANSRRPAEYSAGNSMLKNIWLRSGFGPLTRVLGAVASTTDGTSVMDDGDGERGNTRDADSYDNDGDGNASHAWYGASELMPSRVRRHPGHGTTTSLDVSKFSLTTLIQTGLAKVKTLTFLLKLLVIVAIKLKLMAMFKMFLFTKFFVIGKLLKVFLLPFLPSLLSTYVWPGNGTCNGTKLCTKLCTSSRTAADVPVTRLNAEENLPDGKDGIQEIQATKMSTEPDRTDTDWLFSRSGRSVKSALSARCVQRAACYSAGSRSPSLQSILTNGILTNFADYIPNKKFKSYVLTFKNVSDYRLENIFSKNSTEDWLKWCDKRYNCNGENPEKTNLV